MEIIECEIGLWINMNPYYQDYFRKKSVKALVKLCEIAVQDNPLREKLIIDFIAGLALIPIYNVTKNEQYGEELDTLMKPVIVIVSSKVTSEEYRKFLIDKEISGEAIARINDVTVPISQKEILLHIERSNSIPLTLKDIADIEKNWLRYKQQQYRTIDVEKKTTQKRESKLKFKPEEINTIFNLLKDFFSEDHQVLLLKLLKTGTNATEKLIFLSTGNLLADAFKQLINAKIIIGVQKKELEAWIQKNFCYRHGNEVKEFTLRYLNEIISTNKCISEKNAILILKQDKVTGYYSIIKA